MVKEELIFRSPQSSYPFFTSSSLSRRQNNFAICSTLLIQS